MERPCQRPSWNYRAEGGGLVLDMYPHWRYLIETAVGRIVRVASTAWTAVPERVDEQRERYGVKVEDLAATLVEVEGRIFGTIMSSWATRVRRDDLLTLQVDGTQASAIAGLHRCHVQSNVQTPDIAHFSVMKDLAIDYRGGWAQAPPLTSYCNPYRVGWEQFLRHVATGAPMVSDFSAGVRDVAFASAPGWRCPVSRRGGFQTRPPSAGAVYDAQSPTLTSNLAEDRVCCLRPL